MTNDPQVAVVQRTEAGFSLALSGDRALQEPPAWGQERPTAPAPGAASRRDTEVAPGSRGDLHAALCPRGDASRAPEQGVWGTKAQAVGPGAAADALRQCRLRPGGALRPRERALGVLSSHPSVPTDRYRRTGNYTRIRPGGKADPSCVSA